MQAQVETTPQQRLVEAVYRLPLREVLTTLIVKHGSVELATVAINKRTGLTLWRQTVHGWLAGLGLSSLQVKKDGR